MRKIKMLWFLLPACVLLSVTLVGAASARPGNTPSPVVQKTLTVSASDCYPWSDDASYFNAGWFLISTSGENGFLCPAYFPEYGTHVVSEIIMYAYDRNSDFDLCFEATLTNPTTKLETAMGELCTSGSSTTDPRTPAPTISGAQINPNTVGVGNGMYFWVSIEETDNLRLYGFRITYSVGA